MAMCALAEAVNGRITHSDRILKNAKVKGDPVVGFALRAVDSIVSQLRHPGDGGVNRINESIDGLIALGHADVARTLSSVDRVLAYAQAEGLPHANLTPSELDILRLLAEGLIPKEIAAKSGRSIYTVRVHIANVIAKLGCHGRADALRAAARMGLISTPLG